MRFGLALVVVIVAGAAIIISRRNYAKAAIFESSIDAFRLEFRRSIDAAQAATIKGVAKTIRDSISSVIKPIDSAVRDLDARLARLEQQHADAAASHAASAQILDVRLARLEEHADGSAIHNLDARLARLEEHADAGAIERLDARLAGLEKHTEVTATEIAGTQKQALAENERIAARLIGLEQNLTALTDQLSSIKQLMDGAAARERENQTAQRDHEHNLTALRDQLSAITQTMDGAAAREQEILTALRDQEQNLTALRDQLSSIKQSTDDAAIRERDIKTSVETLSSRVLTAQTRLDELLPRLVLGDKARQDLATLMSWFVSRLKKLTADSTETGRRICDLESRFAAKPKQLAEPDSSILERTDSPPTSNGGDPVSEPAQAGGAALLMEAKPMPAKAAGDNAAVFEPAAGKDSSVERAPRTRAGLNR